MVVFVRNRRSRFLKGYCRHAARVGFAYRLFVLPQGQLPRNPPQEAAIEAGRKSAYGIIWCVV